MFRLTLAMYLFCSTLLFTDHAYAQHQQQPKESEVLLGMARDIALDTGDAEMAFMTGWAQARLKNTTDMRRLIPVMQPWQRLVIHAINKDTKAMKSILESTDKDRFDALASRSAIAWMMRADAVDETLWYEEYLRTHHNDYQWKFPQLYTLGELISSKKPNIAAALYAKPIPDAFVGMSLDMRTVIAVNIELQLGNQNKAKDLIRTLQNRDNGWAVYARFLSQSAGKSNDVEYALRLIKDNKLRDEVKADVLVNYANYDGTITEHSNWWIMAKILEAAATNQQGLDKRKVIKEQLEAHIENKNKQLGAPGQYAITTHLRIAAAIEDAELTRELSKNLSTNKYQQSAEFDAVRVAALYFRGTELAPDLYNGMFTSLKYSSKSNTFKPTIKDVIEAYSEQVRYMVMPSKKKLNMIIARSKDHDLPTNYAVALLAGAALGFEGVH